MPRQLMAPLSIDLPGNADVVRLALQEGDVIVIGTDGLFDNLFDHDICHLALHNLDAVKQCGARRLAPRRRG